MFDRQQCHVLMVNTVIPWELYPNVQFRGDAQDELDIAVRNDIDYKIFEKGEFSL